jgi:hypothetical protein
MNEFAKALWAQMLDDVLKEVKDGPSDNVSPPCQEEKCCNQQPCVLKSDVTYSFFDEDERATVETLLHLIQWDWIDGSIREDAKKALANLVKSLL